MKAGTDTENQSMKADTEVENCADMETENYTDMDIEPYTDFASVYDTFMDETPYEEWCDYLVELIRKYQTDDEIKINDTGVMNKENDTDVTNIKGDAVEENLRQERNTILDIGCGTGTLTELLARQGYDMIGIDNSSEMLQIAMKKREQSGLDILYLLQDMRELELYGTVGAAVSVCDSINYLLEEEEIVQTFRLVNNYLYPQGIFIFDFNTVYKYEKMIGDTTIAENRDECSFIWENYYHEAEEVNEYDLTIFVREDDKNGLFRKFQETHYQRGYCLEQMLACVERAGLQFVEAVDADTHGEVTDESGRIYVVARKGTEANSWKTIL